MDQISFAGHLDLEELSEVERRETPRASSAFEIYFQLGPRRTLTEVSKRADTRYDTVIWWAKKYRWDERVLARERRSSEILEQERLKQIAEAKKRLIEQGKELQDLGLQHLRNKARIRGRGGLNDVVAIQMVQTGMRAELRGHDLPETITRQETTGKDGGAIAVEQVNQARDALLQMIERHAEALGSSIQNPPALPASPPPGLESEE